LTIDRWSLTAENASFRLRRFRNPLKKDELAPPQAQKCNYCFADIRLFGQKQKSVNHCMFNNIANQQGRTKDKRRAKPRRGNSCRMGRVTLDKN
jgi:hypothetical protein